MTPINIISYEYTVVLIGKRTYSQDIAHLEMLLNQGYEIVRVDSNPEQFIYILRIPL